MCLTERANDFNRTIRMMVIVMALFNVPQYTRMVSLTRDYIYMMTEPVFISIHYFELMFINYWCIAHFESAMPKIAKNGLYITCKKQRRGTPVKSQSSDALQQPHSRVHVLTH